MDKCIIDLLKDDNLQELKSWMGKRRIKKKVNKVYHTEEGEDYDEEPFLHAAIRVAKLTGKSKCAEWLIERGADVNSVCHWGWTPLRHLIMDGEIFGNPETVLRLAKLLIKHGADVNWVDDYDENPLLYHAVKFCPSMECIELLIESGANVNWYNEHGSTLLHIAAAEGKVECADLLVRHGANPDAVDKMGYSVKDMEDRARIIAALSYFTDMAIGMISE